MTTNDELYQILLSFTDKNTEEFGEPFRFNEWSCATDGHVMIIVPAIIDNIEKSKHDVVGDALINLTILGPMTDGEWLEIPEIPELPKHKCKSCGGSGRIKTCIECDGLGEMIFQGTYHEYVFTCKECDGIGVIPGDEKACEDCDGKGWIQDEVLITDFNGRRLNGYILEKIKKLPGAMIFSEEDGMKINYFKFYGGQGIFMGIRD